ncbi:unnamed protein product, partial [Rotaria sp. Silwood2]
PDYRQIQFNSERFVPGHYRIYNYRRSHLASSDINASPYEYVSVGEWKTGRNKNGQLNLATDSIVWPSSNIHSLSSTTTTIIPISRCSEPCRVGELRQIQGDSCCWVCIPCNETSIVVESHEHERCEQCAIGYWPTINRTSCYKLQETYIDILSIQALVPICLSIIGNILTLFVVILFYKKRETPVVKASGKELCFIMLAGIHLCYLMTFPILVKPHVITCIIQRLGIGLGFSMMYAALLTKTNRIARIFESTKKQGKLRPQYISPNSQVAICSCLILVQLLLSLLWLAYERPSVDLIAYDRSVTLKCHMNKHSFLFSLTYNVLLVLVCTMYAIRTRKVPENFNETKFIGFTCYTTCIIWLAFLPIYFTAYETGRHQVHIATLCITISLCATVALACLFSPKVYIILLHPEKNMRLTKQIKAQANTLPFTSKGPTQSDYTSNHQKLTPDLSNNDVQSKSLASNDNEENCQPLVSKLTVTFQPIPNECKKKDKITKKNNNKNKPTIITTTRSDNILNNEKYQVKIKKYDDDDDDDSLNSNPIQDEEGMLQ